MFFSEIFFFSYLQKNITELECYEDMEKWEPVVKWFAYLVQGVSVSVIGIFGFIANVLSVIVLLKCKDNRNFHRLLAGMAIIDIILISVTVLEMSIIGK